uniref:Uncharacterized protein n=1 Tax=Glossina austeni TaxID=7395 RepID=A0A1A9VGP3_GLOAU
MIYCMKCYNCSPEDKIPSMSFVTVSDVFPGDFLDVCVYTTQCNAFATINSRCYCLLKWICIQCKQLFAFIMFGKRDEKQRVGREFFYKLRKDLHGYGNEKISSNQCSSFVEYCIEEFFLNASLYICKYFSIFEQFSGKFGQEMLLLRKTLKQRNQEQSVKYSL